MLQTRAIYSIINFIRLWPHYLVFLSIKNKIVKDFDRWRNVVELSNSVLMDFLILMTFYKEFRNVLYFRSGFSRHFLKFLCPPVSTLFICKSTKVGPGLFIQHGYGTIIDAAKVGSNCWINQLVTIGNTDKGCNPTILDNVSIGSGAIILGNIQIGNNSVIGAGAVIVKNVPDNCVVVGNPACIVKKNGIKTHEIL